MLGRAERSRQFAPPSAAAPMDAGTTCAGSSGERDLSAASSVCRVGPAPLGTALSDEYRLFADVYGFDARRWAG